MQMFHYEEFKEDVLRFIAEQNAICKQDIQSLIGIPEVEFHAFTYTDQPYLTQEQLHTICDKIHVNYEDYLIDIPSTRKSTHVCLNIDFAHCNEEVIQKLILEARQLFSPACSSFTVNKHYSSRNLMHVNSKGDDHFGL